MKSGEFIYIWQQSDWPHWRFDATLLAVPLAAVHRTQGRLAGRMEALALQERSLAALQVLSHEVLTTSEIEGEQLPLDTVRSSFARRLNVDIGALAPADRLVDGVVDMVLDATQGYAKPLTAERLQRWQTGLFLTEGAFSTALHPVETGRWRTDSTGAMQVVSGALGRQTVHFEAPPAAQINAEMQAFLSWFNANDSADAGGIDTKTAIDPVLKAGLAHLWLVTIHPFADGNGRIARAVGDMALARAEQSSQRFYSLSAQIQRERLAYYTLLEATQKGSLDVTAWLSWFLACLLRAITAADAMLSVVLNKSRFWQRWAAKPFNPRQIKLLNRLLDGFEGKLTTSKWAAIAKCSPDTALRDIQDLLERGVLHKSTSGGRSTSYGLEAEVADFNLPVE